jgi:hypothetical protein
MHLPTPLSAEPATQQSIPQSVDVDDQVPLALLHFPNGMRLQSQLLSDERFNEHFDPLPFASCQQTTLRGLDESGIHAGHSDVNLLHLKAFNRNHTFRTGASC